MEIKPKVISLIGALMCFFTADMLFMSGIYCQYHPLVGYWVLHLPLYYLNALFVLKSSSGTGISFQWHQFQVPLLGVHIKVVLEISTNFAMLYLTRVFNEPLSDLVPNAVDVYLLASVAFLIIYAMLISYHVPKFDLGVSFTSSLTGMYMPVLIHISGISFQLKAAALVVLFGLIVIKSFIEMAIKCLDLDPDPPRNNFSEAAFCLPQVLPVSTHV